MMAPSKALSQFSYALFSGADVTLAFSEEQLKTVGEKKEEQKDQWQPQDLRGHCVKLYNNHIIWC